MRRALYILGQLNETDIRWMVQTGARRTVEPGTMLVEAGKTPADVYIVMDGGLAVQTEAGADIARLAAGDIVGEMSLIEKRPPAVSVVATETSVVLAVPQAATEARLAADDGFAARFYRALAVFLSDRLRTTVSQMGYGEPGGPTPMADDGELDEGVLDSLHVAGERMRRLASITRRE